MAERSVARQRNDLVEDVLGASARQVRAWRDVLQHTNESHTVAVAQDALSEIQRLQQVGMALWEYPYGRAV